MSRPREANVGAGRNSRRFGEALFNLHLTGIRSEFSMSCSLCRSQGALVKRSHVIPQWMYGLLPNDGRNFRIISPVDGEYEKRSQAGLYDSFVCQICEDRFGKWDNYAATVLRKTPVTSEAGIDFGAYDYGKLARFYLSVVWRMHACSLPIMSIDLGPAAANIGNALLNGDSSALAYYEIVPTWSCHVLSLGIAEPRLINVDGTPHWKIYMPRFQALINLSGEPGPARLAPWKLGAGRTLLMLEDTFESGEVEMASTTLRTNMERKDDRRH
jgi:hypothetical protein